MRLRHTKNNDTFYLEVSDQKLSDLKKKSLKRSLNNLLFFFVFFFKTKIRSDVHYIPKMIEFVQWTHTNDEKFRPINSLNLKFGGVIA